MASISIMVTDNENGVINNSFSFTEAEIKRIRDALGSIYKEQLKEPPILNPNGEPIEQPYNPKAVNIFSILSQSLVSHIINTCQEEELNRAVEQFRSEIPSIELKAQ